MPTPAPAQPDLAPHYYRDNFFRLLDTVEAQYADLLHAHEQAFINRLRAAGFSAQCLYVRLVSRVGPWFREAKLEYTELGDCAPLLDELLAADLAVAADALALADLARLCTRAELAALFDTSATRKADLLDEIAATEPDPQQLCAALLTADDARIVAPSHPDTVTLLQLLFFGNRRQSLTDFVLSDLGVARYYPYSLDRSRRLFPCREAVDEYLEFAALADLWHELQDSASSTSRATRLSAVATTATGNETRLSNSPDSSASTEDEDRRNTAPIHGRLGLPERRPGHPWPRTPPGGPLPVTDSLAGSAQLARVLLAFPARFPTSRRRRDRLCNSVARQLEREGELELALAVYRDSGTHPARERAARVLENLGEERAALEAAEVALGDPWCEEERDAMGRIATRLARKLGVPGYKRRRDDFAMLDLQVPRVERGVERAAAQCLVGEWSAVYYVENQLMNALFGLAFWEEIFAPVAGAFTNPFQSAPADMYDGGFREARRELLEARFAQLAGADLGEELSRAHAAYCDYQCRWVNWRAVDAELVAAAAATVPAQHLLAIWRRMLFDPRENRRGFPDLLALGEAPGEYCMVEVKGPGDTLQESQKRWLRFFAGEGIPAAVARVSWSDA